MSSTTTLRQSPQAGGKLPPEHNGFAARCGADIGRGSRGEALITAGDAPRELLDRPLAWAGARSGGISTIIRSDSSGPSPWTR